MRAMSNLRVRSFLMPSTLPRLFWKRIRKSCSAAFTCSLLSSSSLRLRIFSNSIVFFLTTKSIAKSYLTLLLGNNRRLDIVALDEAGLQRKLVGRKTHGFFGELRGDAFHLEQDAAGTNDADPVIGSAFTFTHTGFGRLLGDRLVGKQTEPDLAATLDETRHRDTAGFDLAVGDVTALHNLEAVVAEREIGAAPRLAAHAAALLLAKLDLLWHQHKKTLFTLSGNVRHAPFKLRPGRENR